MKNFATKVFKYRSYTPIPFVIVMLIFQQATLGTLIGGFIVALCGELIRLWGVSIAGSETRTTGKVGGTYLVVTGPFAYVKNPLYLGNILLYMGIGIMSWALFPYLQIVAFLFFYWQYHVIIKEEEGFLREKFGKDYDEYYKAVPRLFPRLTPYKTEGVEQPPFKLHMGLRSETRTLQAFSAVTIILVIVYIIGQQ
ncbi:MAG: protein-S-isoprenylcysteine methyltransferase [Ignavibacteria bacterium GWB2_35_6b]|nr:MAG: protein-S-isoprenylcysteine methyltransferase [Ignavibacteria bacterium GWB2_35_6b]